MKRTLLSSLVGFLWILAPLGAQDVTGALAGRVLNEQGDFIEGAQVTVQSAVLQGSRTSSSDSRGRFAVPSLPAGSYTVSIRRIGYGSIRYQNVRIRLGTTTSLDAIRLAEQAVDVPEVVSEVNRDVDPVSPATGTALDSSRLLSLPVQRDFRALISFFPQANATPFGDGANVAGGTGLENAFYVDGMNVTVGTGTSIDLPFNFLREIQITTGGYEAEWGRALSGLINVVTQSGGNAFRGQAVGFFTSDELRMAPRTGVGQIDAVNSDQYDFGLSLSGPIKRDRLWYFAAYNPTFANQDVVVGTLRQRDTQVHHLLAGKLLWSLSERTNAAVTILADPFTHETVQPNVLPATTLPSAALGRATGGGSTVALQVRHALDPRTELHLSASRLDRRDTDGPRAGSADLETVTRIDDFTTDASTGGVGLHARNRESRTAVRASLGLHRGAHAVKLGAEYEDNAFSSDFVASTVSRTASNVYDWLEIFLSARVHNRVPTFYFQDAWQVNPRLRLTAGVRLEGQYISGKAGPNRTIAPELAPRLGAVYELGMPGTQRVFANAGRFFEQVVPLSLTVWNGSGFQLVREFPQNPLVDSSNGVVLGRLDLTGVPSTKGLVGQYYDKVSLGYERRLGNLKLGAIGTYRILRWALEDGIAPGDSMFRMGNPGRGALATMPRARQRYAALEVKVERSTPGPFYDWHRTSCLEM